MRKLFTASITDQLLKSDVPNVKEATISILDRIEDESGITTSSESSAPAATVTSRRHLHFSIYSNYLLATSSESTSDSEPREATPKNETEDLLRKLNLEESVRWQDIVLIKKIGEGQYGDVWEGNFQIFCFLLLTQSRKIPFLSSCREGNKKGNGNPRGHKGFG